MKGKITVEEMPQKNYDPQAAEPELIEKWIKADCFMVAAKELKTVQ